MAREVNEQEYRLIDRVTQGFQTIANGLGKLRTGMTELNQSAELAGKAISGIASVGRFFADQANDVGAYELALKRVEVRTQATAEESALLRQAITQALGETAFGAQAAAEAMRALAEDGASATESANALGPALAYAQANAQGAVETVTRLGAVLDAFDEPAAKIGVLADQLTATATAAGTSTQALEEGLAGAGNAAAQAELSIGQTLELLGALAKRGVEGAQAGRQLATILRELSDPASAAGEALRAVGLDGDNLAVALRQLAQDSGAAEAVLSALGDKPREKLRLLLADGGASLAGIAAALDDSAGAAKRASDAVGDTFTLAWQKLVASIEGARNTFLAPSLDVLTERLQAFSDRIDKVSQSEQFKALADEIARFVDSGLKEFDRFLAGFDFDTAGQSVEAFTKDTVQALKDLQEALKGTAEVGLNFKDGTIVAFEAARTAVAGSLASLIGAVGGFSEEAETLSLVLAGVAEEARNNTGEAMARLADRMEASRLAAAATARAADDLGQSIPKLGAAAADTGPALDAFGNDLARIGDKTIGLLRGPYSLEALAKSAGGAAAALAEIPKPATILEGTFTNLEDALQAQIEKLEEARKAYYTAFDAGSAGANEAWEAVKRAGSQVAELRRQLDATKVSAADLGKAFDELGFKSQAALQETARKGEEAFDTIVSAANRGEAAQADVTRAFEEYARRLASTAELADDSARAQIARQIELKGRIAGVSDELIRAGTAGLRAGEVIAQAGEEAADGWGKVKREAKETATTLKAAADVAEESGRRTAEAAERTAAALEAQRSIQLELSDGWREQAEAIGVNTLAWDRLLQIAESHTDRMLSLSRKRKAAQEEETKATEDALKKTEELQQAQNGALNFGRNEQGNQSTQNQTQAEETRQSAQSAAAGQTIVQHFHIDGAWSDERVKELAAILDRRARLAR